jgi:hypothetical protein
MVGLLYELGQTAYEFVWPAGSFDQGGGVPVARCIAVPDSAVEAEYWRENEIQAEQLLSHSGVPHSLQVVARLGQGMGHSRNPNTIMAFLYRT